ncbi:MAG: DUF362 domain-containing protein [Candidatus Pacearchaeota archaeon]|jgi:uncharacterized protein (DUF362 family)/ferredoxin
MKKSEDIPKVSIVHCSSYNQKKVDKAIKTALKFADLEIPFSKTVLIKPNIIGSFPKKQKIATTNPSIIEAICKILKKNKCKIIIGESSFTNTVDAFKDSGIEKIAKKYNAEILIFEQDKLKRIKNENGKILKEFYVSRKFLEADLIINVPKLKTHLLMKYTGAIKNLYGVIPGGIKQKLHAKAPTEKKFSSLLVDIYEKIQPEINIMDGVVGMEGKGPSAGDEKKSEYILASSNAVALDIVCSKLIGYNPKKILYLKEVLKRKIFHGEFVLVGQEKIPNLKFKKPTIYDKLTVGLKELLNIRKSIVVDKEKCVKCGLCSRKCPQGAITLCPYPIIDKKKCIRCFCCMEICPHHALSLK